MEIFQQMGKTSRQLVFSDYTYIANDDTPANNRQMEAEQTNLHQRVESYPQGSFASRNHGR